MNNLHRELAPISEAAWADLEEETTRTLKRHLAGRRVVDVQGAGGVGLSAVGTGHLKTIAAPGDGILTRQRDVKALVEFRVPFELTRQAIDDVERGSNDSDWQPLKDAARTLAFSEDRLVFEGYGDAGIRALTQVMAAFGNRAGDREDLCMHALVTDGEAVIAEAVSRPGPGQAQLSMTFVLTLSAGLVKEVKVYVDPRALSLDQ